MDVYSSTNLWNDNRSMNMGAIAGSDNLMGDFMRADWASDQFKTDLMITSMHQATDQAARIMLEAAMWVAPMPKIGLAGKAIRGLSSTSKGCRVFWSGGNTAKLAAESFAKSTGGKTLEMTLKGKTLTGLTNMTSYKLTAPLLNKASASFARGAKGSANVFHNAGTGVRLKSVWKTTEYPILKSNNTNLIFHNIY